MDHPERAIAHVLRPDGTVAGLAYLIGPDRSRTVLTCAHVVNFAVGRDLRDSGRIDPMASVRLDFPLLGEAGSPVVRQARVVVWRPSPVRPFDNADVSVLWLDADVPVAGLTLKDVPPLPEPVQIWGPAPGSGLGQHVPAQLTGYIGKGRLQADQIDRANPLRVAAGFSGGPVWTRDGGVVGMVQAVRSGDSDRADDVVVVDAAALRAAAGVWAAVAGDLVVLSDEAGLTYDRAEYRLRQCRILSNQSAQKVERYLIRVSVGRFPKDLSRNLEHHSRFPLRADALGLRASFDGGSGRRSLTSRVKKANAAEIEFWLNFSDGSERFPLRPGEIGRLEYTYRVDHEQWGQWFQRAVRLTTSYLSFAVRLPIDLEPECWCLRTSEGGVEPLPGLRTETAGSERVFTYTASDADGGLALSRRYRMEWFFRARVRADLGTAPSSDVMQQFGIYQRGSEELAGEATVVDLPADGERAAAILAHLRRVAGWAQGAHSFQPGTAMGLAAPQLGIDRAIAIVRRPYTDDYLELVNPVIVGADRPREDFEGCLSFFDYRGEVSRHEEIDVEYQTCVGTRIAAHFTGALARGIQHEVDHLHGRLFDSRLPPGRTLLALSEYHAEKARREAEARPDTNGRRRTE